MNDSEKAPSKLVLNADRDSATVKRGGKMLGGFVPASWDEDHVAYESDDMAQYRKEDLLAIAEMMDLDIIKAIPEREKELIEQDRLLDEKLKADQEKQELERRKREAKLFRRVGIIA